MSSSGLGLPVSRRLGNTLIKGRRDSTLVGGEPPPLEDRGPLRALVLVPSQDAVDAGEKLRPLVRMSASCDVVETLISFISPFRITS
jgi:hypothetical protein